VKLSNNLANAPQLVKNYRTKGMDIVVQDIDHILYLISNEGKILWKKQLKSAILGKVNQVDLYRNGRLQLAFATSDHFYILDRNGNEVAPFPLAFKDDVTQPLSVFDYDGNRNYRFVITQGENLLMYNRDANIVTGFNFTKANHDIVFPPKHIRISGKDYIIVQEQDGTLNILGRTGKTRIPVNEKFDFGDYPLFESKTGFVLYDKEGNKFEIAQNGKISTTKKSVNTDYLAAVEGQNQATLSNNILKINNKENELDFGLYNGLTIVKAGKDNYVTLTDEQAKRLFVFDAKGNMLPNFPVYGNSEASLGLLERNKSLGFVVKGESDTVLIYRIN
ncbi:MAG: ribonuclease HII, partial [Leeuwenhoekiella sp.]